MTYELFKFCIINVLPVHLFNNLLTSFHANAHKINNTTAPVAWCTEMQNKHKLPTNSSQCTLLTKHCEIERKTPPHLALMMQLLMQLLATFL